MDLTPKQALFVQEYLVDLNATQAALRAGYSAKTSGSVGNENLKKPQIAKAIAEALLIRAKRVEVNQDYVLYTIVDVIERAKLPGAYNATAVLKGVELLGRHLGMFNKLLHGSDPDNPLPTPTGDVIIYNLPDNQRG